MNKLAPLFSVLLGLTFAFSINVFFPKNKPLGDFISHTSLYFKGKQNKELLLDTVMELELKESNTFDNYILTSKNVGFSSNGSYEIKDNHISFRVNSHEKIVPKRELKRHERMLIRGDSFSNEENPFAQLSNGNMLLFTNYATFYLKKNE